MSAGYSRLPNPSSNHDPERELEDAFQLEDDLDDGPNQTPNSHNRNPSVRRPLTQPSHTRNPSGVPPAYDFERQDYDFPPPGSPPGPSSRALPNNYGNSNGFVPTSPLAYEPPRPSVFRRILGTLLPSQYQRLPSGESSHRSMGGGTENDGVFANVAAKPQAGKVVRNEDGSIYVVPEEAQKELPPTYAEAQADAVPPYWETTIHAPAGLAGLDPSADMVIDDLPTGSFFVFATNLIVSFFFQFVGFLLTYMLHTSHAAKYGSRAGLGLTLIQYGFYSRIASQEEQVAIQPGTASGPPYPLVNVTLPDGTTEQVDPNQLASGPHDWLSFLFMTLGWFLLLSSCVGYWRVKRWEKSIRTPQQDPTSPEDAERDRAIRRHIENVFGVSFDDDNDHPVQAHPVPHPLTPQAQQALEAEARLTRDLRAAGLI